MGNERRNVQNMQDNIWAYFTHHVFATRNRTVLRGIESFVLKNQIATSSFAVSD